MRHHKELVEKLVKLMESSKAIRANIQMEPEAWRKKLKHLHNHQLESLLHILQEEEEMMQLLAEEKERKLLRFKHA